MTIQTFTPIRGMLFCVNGTGDYVKTSDYRALADAVLKVAKSGMFGCCPFCGAGWDGPEDEHSTRCPVRSVALDLPYKDPTPAAIDD